MTVDRKCLINWVGGKRLLRKTIAPLIPKDIKSYIRPFGGGGWVLFYKDRWADLEIYNDLDGRLVNLFRIVKYHPNALKEELKYLLGSREMFFQFLNGTFITDIQKAAQFLFLITRSFGGRGDTFGKQYDFEDAFFYCDPPYTSGCGYEVTSTADFDHERLRDVLKDIKGRFLISYDDSPKVRELYKGYEMIEVERQNGINNREGTNRANKVYKELLIANYHIKEQLCK